MKRAARPTFKTLRQPAVAGALLFVLALALRLYRLGAQSLWLDEGGTWAEVTQRGWGALLRDLLSPNAAYPLYHLVLKGWVGLAGDAEWALRFPSALAGAAGVVAIFFAARELVGATDEGRPTTDDRRPTKNSRRTNAQQSPRLEPFVAALLFADAPFALWQSQDAKAYSLLTLVAALLVWSLLRALRTTARRDWLVLAGVALVSLLVHRLALLAVLAALLVVVLLWPFRRAGVVGAARWLLLLGVAAGALAAIYGVAQAVGAENRGGSGHVPAGPLTGLWLSVAHFALDRGNIDGWLGVPLLVWALPALALTLWGLVRLARAVWRGDRAALATLCMFAVPLLLFASALLVVRLFESRYVTVAFPAWVLLISAPLGANGPAREKTSARSGGMFGALCALVLAVNAAVLFQPEHGLFSGAAVKEQWRDGVAAIAARAHPDDLLIVHPYYVMPMWQYYAPRVTPDPLPQPATFNVLGQGDCMNQRVPVECYRREYEKDFDAQARGHARMLMLIAPEHARTIDPPKTLAELQAEWESSPHPDPKAKPPTEPDKYGVLGLRFQFADDQRTWPCGGSVFVGVEVMCASFPSRYQEKGAASIPQPAVSLPAVFGGEIGLRGYTIAPLGGELRPGGHLPITLFWAAAVPPTRDYTMFLHLCGDCDAPPLAQDDRRPLDGYYPAGQTTTWKLDDPVHDERSLLLPADLPPGRYTLLLGVYPAGDPAESARLPVQSSAPVRGGTRLVLGEIAIGQ